MIWKRQDSAGLVLLTVGVCLLSAWRAGSPTNSSTLVEGTPGQTDNVVTSEPSIEELDINAPGSLDSTDLGNIELPDSLEVAQALPRPAEITLNFQETILIDQLASTVLSVEILFPENTEATIGLSAEISNDFKIKEIIDIIELRDVDLNTVNGNQQPLCQLTNALDCLFEISPETHSVHIELDVESLQATDGKLIVETRVGENTDDTVGNDGQQVMVHEIELISVLPVSILIDKVLNAPEGANVELPPGTYGGTFALPLWQRDEWTTITGASGDEPTVLIGGLMEPLFVDLPLGFTVSNMELRSFGHPIVGPHRSMVTFDNNLVVPANPEYSIQKIDSLFTNYQGESLRLINNRISNWGIGQQHDCNNLITATAAEIFIHVLYSYGELHVQHNVFDNNHCKSLMSVQYQGDLTIENNTLINNDSAVVDIERLPRRLTFFNNIIAGGRSEVLYKETADPQTGVLSLQEEAAQATFTANQVWFTLASNILWNTTSTDIVNDSMRSISGFNELQRAEYVDPLFVDIESGDYALQPTSPAIDKAGIIPTGYRLHTVYGGCFRTICDVLDRFWTSGWDIYRSGNTPSYWLENNSSYFVLSVTRDEFNPQPMGSAPDAWKPYDIGAIEFDPE